MKLTALIFHLVLFFISTELRAETKITQSQKLYVELHDSTTTDAEKTVRILDVNSGKVAHLNLVKSPLAENQWSGYFIIQFFKGDNTDRVFEFSEPNKDNYYAFATKEKSTQKIVLFNNSDEMSTYAANDSILKLKEQEKSLNSKNVKVEVMSQQKIQQLELNVRQQNQLQEKTQMAIEEDQTKKRLNLLEQQQKLDQEEKLKRKKEANDLAAEGDKLYAQKKYKSAIEKYIKASELDPEDESYYYRYGVSLYKTDEYNKSLAVLAVSDAPDGSELEKDYYIALNHLKLKDYDKAKKELIEIRQENDANLSPIASYLAGTIEMQRQQFPVARKSMEYVLDKSKDPKLDKSAEDALDQIDRLENYFNSKKEKYRFTVFGGLSYDSNVLNIAANNVATDVQAYRATYGATALGIWYRTPTSDLGTQVGLSDYYSVNSQLQSDSTIQTADPLEFDFLVPYHKEINTQKNTYNFEITPFYKSIAMSSSTNSTRSELIRSIGFDTAVSTALKSDWYLSTKLDYSSDNFNNTVTSNDDVQTGTKYGITIVPTKMLDLKGDKSISGELGYTINQSNGVNYRYNKIATAATYSFPFYKNSNASARLDYYTQNYSVANTPRIDSTAALTLSDSKDLKKYLNLLFSFQYTNSSSPVDTYNYNKFALSALLTYTTSIYSK